ncbi:MAG TPA: hypothetical protein VI356_00105 [Myxococcales bacterium]
MTFRRCIGPAVVLAPCAFEPFSCIPALVLTTAQLEVFTCTYLRENGLNLFKQKASP